MEYNGVDGNVKPITKKIGLIIVSIPGTWQRLLLNSVEAHPSVEVIGVAHGGISAIQQAIEHRPQFIFIDASIPIDEAVALIAGVKKENLQTMIIVLADTSQQRRKAAQAGANYVLSTFDYASRLGDIFSAFLVGSPNEN